MNNVAPERALRARRRRPLRPGSCAGLISSRPPVCWMACVPAAISALDGLGHRLDRARPRPDGHRRRRIHTKPSRPTSKAGPGRWPAWPDGVIVTNYLWRPRPFDIVAAAAPAACCTKPAQGNESVGCSGPGAPDFPAGAGRTGRGLRWRAHVAYEVSAFSPGRSARPAHGAPCDLLRAYGNTPEVPTASVRRSAMAIDSETSWSN